MNSPVTVKRCAEFRIDFELKRESLYHPAYFFLGSDLKGYKTKQYEALFEKSRNTWFLEGNGEVKSTKEKEGLAATNHSFLNKFTLSYSSVDKGTEYSNISNPRSALVGISKTKDDKIKRDQALFFLRMESEDKKKKPDLTIVIVLYQEATYDRLLEAIYRERKRKFSALARFSEDLLHPGQKIFYSDELDENGIDRGPFTIHNNCDQSDRYRLDFRSEIKFLDI